MTDNIKEIKTKHAKKDIDLQYSSTTLDKLIAILVESEKEGDRAYYSLDIENK